MAMHTHIIRHLLITDLAVSGLLGLLHSSPSLHKAACRQSKLAWMGVGSVLGGGGTHLYPHDSPPGRAEHWSTVYQLFMYCTYEHNCIFNGSDGTRFTPDPFLSGTWKNEYFLSIWSNVFWNKTENAHFDFPIKIFFLYLHNPKEE